VKGTLTKKEVPVMFPTRSTLEAIATRFESAHCPEEVFGNLDEPGTARLSALKQVQRDLTRACHPDRVLAADKALATGLFQALGYWEGIARLKIADGTYGDFRPYVPPAPPYVPVELSVRGKALRLTGLIGEGLFASVHSAQYEGEAGSAVFAKYASNAADNDLLEREFKVLQAFQQPAPDYKTEEFLSKQRAYVPTPLTSFFMKDENGIKHRANLLATPQGRCFTAAELHRNQFPLGIEPRHVWWIFRRLLLTLWMAHRQGYVHGGVTPDHLLIYPEAHGLVLLDWTCAARTGEEHVPAINPEYRGFYPPEVLRKEAAMPATDLFMAASTAIFMLGGDPEKHELPGAVPESFRQLLLCCLAPMPSHRFQDALQFHDIFGAHLGRRVFSEMIVP
jgi:hypothetical protein